MIDSRVQSSFQTRFGVFSFVGEYFADTEGASRTLKYKPTLPKDSYTVYADEIEDHSDQWEVTVESSQGDWEIHNVDGLSLGALTDAVESSMELMIASEGCC